ncbi:MAG: glycosyl hydrolase [Candidatus Omnitrophica bacterium]|nr:glycosyl hydrolase [Candidatus Omnitrophota bacterium]
MFRKKLFLLGLIVLSCQWIAQSRGELVDEFRHPPDSARPWTYWFFMDGNVSREGITADLEAMAKAGLGGVILMEVDVGIPRGPVEFMSEEWRELFKHAVEEAERLGLQITLNAGPGWTGSGGPWVDVEQSMQHLVASAMEVEGPKEFQGILPVPEPRPPYFGESGLPPEILEARKGFYSDVTVLAIPRTDGYRIADIDEKALYVRAPYTSKPGVKPFLPAPAEYPNLPVQSVISATAILDLTDHLQPDGRLNWEVPKGEWTLLRFGRRTTGANTRPAPRPGLGFESDKFDKAALDSHFENFVGKLLEAVGPRPVDRENGWTMLHIDSWEMGSQNWTDGFGAEFRKRRGYDPTPYLPILTGRVVDSLEISERFLWDLRLTAQELVIENHAQHLKELGRRHGFGLSIEPYDMNPTADLTLGGVADVPMCEFWSDGYGFDSAFTCFESTSIAHTLGKPIVAAEAFTAGSGEAWKLYPGAMKNQGDWALCTGINRIVFHRFAHQPWLDRKPGMTMGPYGVHWDRTQTWWPMASAYHQYLARCQHLLRQGSPIADICYLAPEGAPHVFRPPPSAMSGKLRDRRGYNFDGCSPGALIEHAKVESDRIVFPGGAAYRVLVLPDFETMTPTLLRKIDELVASGATVIGPPPRKSPSLESYPECDREVQLISERLWGGGMVEQPSKEDMDEAEEGEFPILYPRYESTARLLAEMDLPPDFESDGAIRYTHRRTDDLEIYFLASAASQTLEADCLFRVRDRIPELWNPITGENRRLPEYSEKEGRTSIPLRFEPYQSFFIVFRHSPDGTAESLSAKSNFPEVTYHETLSGPWRVYFDPEYGGPGDVVFDNLSDWSQHSDPGIRYYSGIATYEKTFALPASIDLNSKSILIDLGEVQNLARVRLNGRDLGVTWCAPWRVEIGDVLKEKNNRLEIEVANLWPNRLIGDRLLPLEKQVAWTTWNPYKADSELLPSGLLGPVRIATQEKGGMQ